MTPIVDQTTTLHQQIIQTISALETAKAQQDWTKAANRDEVKVIDKGTGKEVKVWGDPHIQTSDGDSADFYAKHLTLMLDDGSKITIIPTEVQNGVSWVDRVVITNGNEQAAIGCVAVVGTPCGVPKVHLSRPSPAALPLTLFERPLG